MSIETRVTANMPSLSSTDKKISFQTGPIAGVELTPLRRFTDARGWLVEIYREDEMPGEVLPVMGYVSMTEPGTSRGPHEHVEQSDAFMFLGPGTFRLYLWDARPDSPTFGHRMRVEVGEKNMCRAIVPPGVVHAYENVGPGQGWVINCPNRLYQGPGRTDPIDEIRHEEDPESLYVLD